MTKKQRTKQETTRGAPVTTHTEPQTGTIAIPTAVSAIWSAGHSCAWSFFFFFFNDPPTTEIYPLSLHDALPIYLVFLSQTIGRILHPIRHLDPLLRPGTLVT